MGEKRIFRACENKETHSGTAIHLTIQAAMKVIVLTGPIRSGKTTLLMSVFANKPMVDGFLTPDKDGLRVFYDLRTSEYLEFQTESGHRKDTTGIGRFVFSNAAFRHGNEKLSADLRQETKVMIVDEIGKLETGGEGFAGGIEHFIDKNYHKDIIFLVVIRDTLTELFIQKFGWNSCNLLDIMDNDVGHKLRQWCGII